MLLFCSNFLPSRVSIRKAHHAFLLCSLPTFSVKWFSRTSPTEINNKRDLAIWKINNYVFCKTESCSLYFISVLLFLDIHILTLIQYPSLEYTYKRRCKSILLYFLRLRKQLKVLSMLIKSLSRSK